MFHIRIATSTTYSLISNEVYLFSEDRLYLSSPNYLFATFFKVQRSYIGCQASCFHWMIGLFGTICEKLEIPFENANSLNPSLIP